MNEVKPKICGIGIGIDLEDVAEMLMRDENKTQPERDQGLYIGVNAAFVEGVIPVQLPQIGYELDKDSLKNARRLRFELGDDV